MPWKEASPMDQGTQFIADHLRDTLSITELCELYGISRKTGYRWIDRYLRQGPRGWRNARDGPGIRPMPRRRRSSPRSSRRSRRDLEHLLRALAARPPER